MENSAEHGTFWAAWGPSILAVIGGVVTFAMGAIGWVVKDRRQIGDQLGVIEKKLSEHESDLERILSIHQRWRDGEALKEGYTELFNKVMVEMADLKATVRQLVQRVNGRRHHNDSEDE